MRQSGILAAAGLHALRHHIDRLADDHHHAGLLAGRLRSIPGLSVDGPHTNMVFVRIPAESLAALAAFLKQRDILIFPSLRLRLVTHLGIRAADVDCAGAAFEAFFKERPPASESTP